MKRQIIYISIASLLVILTIASLNDYVQENIIDVHPGIFITGIFLLNIFNISTSKVKK